MYTIGCELGFGDIMMAALIVTSLNDAGIPANLYSSKRSLSDLADCPMGTNRHVHYFDYTDFRVERTCSYPQGWLNRFADICGKTVKISRNYVPVKFTPADDTPVYDVVMGSTSSAFSVYRNWPHTDKLKELLTAAQLTWCDLDKEAILDNKCLNYVNKAGVYLGLETGRSHYVSSQANGKTLILQSGFTEKHQWCNYDYEFIEKRAECAPCFLCNGCQYNRKCMDEIHPEYVLERIVEKLTRKRQRLPVI